ncbi:Rieske 2Fe-2S domain-containing protein [Prochlorococcus sp. MIT 1300]|uniref:Rieske 2Fe-2S domain-containing protein n=1 Tax=Prochlorococcus sp. MIT 1300 TaxID=3096218 RepID=UPI002A755C42|nr:Rieske 2Fe-2S domain-containing protein [Prochlorococcus sp. MIT 1300]
MREEKENRNTSFDVSNKSNLRTQIDSHTTLTPDEHTSNQPDNQLRSGLLGWYAACSSQLLKEGQLYFFSMYNEPLVLYRDKDKKAKCIKDLCPHRGASFQGGQIKDGNIVCPYHGARFSTEGECTNLERITCQHIVDSNYNNYAKKIHLYQYPCIEVDGYIYIYYTGSAKTNVQDFSIKTDLSNHVPETFGFKPKEYAFEEVCVDFKCDWARIIENHLDILHIFWVHGDTIPDKDVNRKVITSFNQKIKRDERFIESKYNHKQPSKGEFITITFVPPGRIFIYKGSPESARYVQVLDHIPLGRNRSRVIVRHYRKFLKNKLLTKLVLFKSLQHRIFYRIFSEDYMVLKTQTFNQQMGYIQKDNVKLLGEDKMVQYYWGWFQNSLQKDNPWSLHPTNEHTNKVHEEMPMLYPPENPTLDDKNNREILIQTIIRLLIPVILIVQGVLVFNSNKDMDNSLLNQGVSSLTSKLQE